MSTHVAHHLCLMCLQVVSALLPFLTDSSWQAKQAAITGIRGLASQGPALRLWVPALVPALLEIACHTRPEVSLWQWHIQGFRCNCFVALSPTACSNPQRSVLQLHSERCCC